MTTWFSADPHFGHEQIIRLCDRPFRDVREMDAHILSMYQAVVRPEDDFWLLGDLAAGRQDEPGRRRVAEIFGKIPGRKHLIIGNHDAAWVRELNWSSTQHFADVAVEGQRVILNHYPMITFPGARRGSIQLFGHVHDNWQGSRNSVNVGVDLWDFMPITAAQAVLRALLLPVNPVWPLVEPDCALD